jgi:hypothetical protein
LDLDRYYTPRDVALQLAGAIDLPTVSGIVDSNCGAGHLLAAASDIFPMAQCMGIDSDEDAVLRLADSRPNWKLVVGDALSEDSWAVYPSFTPDVAVLNPPFSMMHARGVIANLGGEEFRASNAMAHVIAAIHNSNPRRLVAILPESWVYSEMDAVGRQKIAATYDVDVVNKLTNSTFNGARVNALVVSLRRRTEQLAPTTGEHLVFPRGVQVIRGGLPLFEAKNFVGGLPLIHSTDISRIVHGADLGSLRHVSRIGRGVVQGSVVLLPRVGVPKLENIDYVYLRRAAQLSDCVIAVRFECKVDAQIFVDHLRGKWSQFVKIYTGTGARFVTCGRLHDWIAKAYSCKSPVFT